MTSIRLLRNVVAAFAGACLCIAAHAAQGRFLVAAAHLPFPGIGHICADGKGYAWVPVDYTTAR